MKTRGLFLSALMMGAVLAGCSNEEVPQNVEPRDVQKSESYVAVNIVAPSAASRATTDGGFVAGTEAENTVNNALFVFFNENGGFVEAVAASGEDLKEWTAGEGTVDQISNVVLVLEDKKTAPASVVALLNTGYTETSIGTPNLTDLKNMVGNYSEGFVMSNSAYLDGTVDMTATPLSDANFQKTAADAIENPVTITVERVVAKVSALQNAESFTVTGKDVKLDGADVTLVPEITGYKVVATNPVSYLVKNIEDINLDWTWNDAASLRSYWANSAAPEAYTYYKYSEILPVENYAEYCQENTSDDPTLLLVSATIKPEGAETAQNILKYKGLYYTTKGLLTKANEMLADYTYPVTTDEGSGTSNDWAPYLTIVDAGEDAEPWEVKVALTEGAPEVAGVADVINGMDTAAQWTEGKAYFYVAIEGLGGEAGVVRNHYHLLTIDAISGMGTPVYNPEEIIIPKTMPEEEYFVAAKVQILKWKQVNQSVTLQ
ncbi:MAG: Mfa1 family fimbria major subunit [Bacteroidaceae bacterium]|nr:Mfa1 family fimbria major subunit [Bacteroidaceae bacterium]